MHTEELATGLWRWIAPHPGWSPDSEWEQEVASVYFEAADAVCLIDPLVPLGEEERLWTFLDREIERAAKPVATLLTVPWHRRGAEAIGARYGNERETWELSLRSREPPAGVEPMEIAHADERMYWIPAHRALVAGDVLQGRRGGEVAVCPVSWVTRAATYPAEFLASLRGLVELRPEMILVSHGEAVRSGAHTALERAVERAHSKAGQGPTQPSRTATSDVR
jgi:hypothetical protein